MSVRKMRPETGPNKRPRLSAPTTENERYVASQASSTHSNSHGYRTGLQQTTQSLLSPEELRARRLAAIQASLASDPQDGDAPPAQTSRQPTQVAHPNSLKRHKSTEELKMERMRAIQQALEEEERPQAGEGMWESDGAGGLGAPLATSTQRVGRASEFSDVTLPASSEFDADWSKDDLVDDQYDEPAYNGPPVELPTTGFATFSTNGSKTMLKPPDEEVLRKREAMHRQYEDDEPVQEGRDVSISRPHSPGLNAVSDFRPRTSLYPKGVDTKGKGPIYPPRTPLSEVRNRAVDATSTALEAMEEEMFHPATRGATPQVEFRPPVPTRPPQTPARPSNIGRPSHAPSALNPTIRALKGHNNSTPGHGSPKKFVSPFKQNQSNTTSTQSSVSSSKQRVVNYGTPSNKKSTNGSTMASQARPSKSGEATLKRRVVTEAILRDRVFDLENVPRRKTMLAYGIDPEGYSKSVLQRRFLFPGHIFKITIHNAQYYGFGVPPESYGPYEAREELLRRGCNAATATREWVENHWALILWKLAGLVRACPTELKERWCFGEVVRQLLYRYEREWNRGERSPVKKIQEQDVPPGASMVLTVCDISKGMRPKPDKPDETEEWPELMLTDGWYKIRAAVDDCLARAVNYAKIKVGTKIAMYGIRMDAAKEGGDVLKMLNETQLKLTGNSTSYARWYTRLGFSRIPFTPTIASLSPDGGNVFALCLRITRLHPIAYMDMWEEGKPHPIPRCQKEEDAALDEWMKEWEKEQANAWKELEDQHNRLEALAERLDRASNYRRVSRDLLPGWVDDALEELEESDDPKPLLAHRNTFELGCLASAAHLKLHRDRENIHKPLEREMEHRVPPRQVRNFRVAVVEDVRTGQRTAMRTGQLTVWDVLAMEDGLREGGEYRVTNLVPTQKGSWRKPDVESEVFLQTTRWSRWTPLPP